MALFFGGSMQAVLATATIAGLSTSITGVSVLANPIAGTKTITIQSIGLGFVLAPAAPLAFGLATGFNAATDLTGTLTALAVKSKAVGSGQLPTAGLYASAAITLPTVATVDTVLGTLDTGAVTTTQYIPGVYNLPAPITLQPGAYALLWTSAVLAASAHIMSWTWSEGPP